MVHQWGFFGSISAIRKIWSLTANSRSLQVAALKSFLGPINHFDNNVLRRYGENVVGTWTFHFLLKLNGTYAV